MNSKGALLGATTLAARIFREYCAAHRFTGAVWHLFGDADTVLTASADGADIILPETVESLDDFPLLLDFQRGRKTPPPGTGILLSAGIEPPPPTAALVFFGANPTRLVAGGPCAAPHPLSTVLLRTLGAQPVNGLLSGHIVAVTSTEEDGKAGQDELFHQTVALFNAASFKSKVYKEQVAYNLVPAPPDALGERIRAELEAFLGTGWLAPVQTARAGAFFGTLAAVRLEFDSPAAKTAFARTLQANPALEWETQGARGLVRAVQEEGIFVSPAGETDRSFQLWITCDSLRAGMAWNLANLADHFFQLRNTN
jgi:hypothetical protein